MLCKGPEFDSRRVHFSIDFLSSIVVSTLATLTLRVMRV